MSGVSTILVSGGSRGLGAATVLDLIERGHRVATFSRSEPEYLPSVNADVSKRDRLMWAAIDSSDFDAVRTFARQAAERFGRIDALINNAGVLPENVLPLMRASEIRDTLAVNLESVLHLTQSVARTMLAVGDGGCIINVSSVNAVRGYRGVSVYSATKAALDGLTRSLARELGPKNIRVNSVAPGFFESEMTKNMTPKQRETISKRTPLGRLGRTPDITGVIRFLLSPESAFVTGQTIVVDGGLTV